MSNHIEHIKYFYVFVLIIFIRLNTSSCSSALKDNYDNEEGYCAPYNGKVCKSFITGGQVWYSREDPTGGWENEKITTGLWEEIISGLSGVCRTAAEVATLYINESNNMYMYIYQISFAETLVCLFLSAVCYKRWKYY